MCLRFCSSKFGSGALQDFPEALRPSTLNSKRESFVAQYREYGRVLQCYTYFEIITPNLETPIPPNFKGSLCGVLSHIGNIQHLSWLMDVLFWGLRIYLVVVWENVQMKVATHGP